MAEQDQTQAGDRGKIGQHMIRGINVEVSGTVRIIDKNGNVKESEIHSIEEEVDNDAT